MTLSKRILSICTHPKRAQPDGFSLLELMLVVAVLAVVLAIAIPSLLGGRRAAYENTAKQKLATVAQQQTAFKTLLRKGRFGTIAELQATNAGGTPLLSTADTNVTGWTFSDEGASSATAFGAKITPTADNPATYSYYISEDQILRRCNRSGPWSKACTAQQQ